MTPAHKKAFTLIEIILTVVILGIITAVCLPRLNYAMISKQKTDTTALKIVTDLRRTRSLAIAGAAANTSGFALNMIGSAPYHSYRIVNLSNSSIIDTITIDPDITCTGGNSFQFGPMGNLTNANTTLSLSAHRRSFTITIVSATGTIKCTQN